jgi:hypothetical protein
MLTGATGLVISLIKNKIAFGCRYPERASAYGRLFFLDDIWRLKGMAVAEAANTSAFIAAVLPPPGNRHARPGSLDQINPVDELFWDVETARFSIYQAFFGKLVERIAELPGVEAGLGFQGGNRSPFFAALDNRVNLIEYRLPFGRWRFFSNSGFASCFLAFGGRGLFYGLKFVYLFGNSIHLL